MPATRIDLDDETLAAAMRLSGARTKDEAVNLALREYVERRRRAGARIHYLHAAQGWDEESFWRQHAAEKGTV
ncbi:type II toxin-antitoxin system VapB family antitoxin [Streptomyces sp. AP-93]|uniref:type II toxin-antitoxin system VapB family antitoxin n=1 Tax=Streptomyces sp. AP-93 TaxID=2929048 RepID=UPI001FAFA356|nr:type II toxin-antitoxin system VapB family antitoxin [Streptomyces sp. AP-93]MCJ0872284.1 type II toxin-antitoxin system VapB family antitoxin [Streptomyces sp. AP-93]